MYSSYLTRETFENEHDEKMTRKFSYNYKVLKRLFPEVYKLPESEIRSLVHSIYDNPKLGDELLDHLSDVINKKKPEWGEYLNPKPEEPEQTAQNNPLQPVQPKPLNTGSGFEPYKPQKNAFGLGNSGGFGNAGGLGNSSAFGLNNTNNFGTTGGLKQSQLPNFSKGMDLKHSDMVTGFGINEAKQNSMLGTGFSMPKLPKLPQFPKAPEPQIPELPQMPEISQALQVQPMPQYPQIQLANSAYTTQPPMPLAQMQNNSYVDPTYDGFEELKKYLVDKEKMIQYPYLDANGDYTVCVGHMDKTLDDFKKHPWMIKGTNRLATPEEVERELSKLDNNLKNYKVTYFEDLTNLELPEEYCLSLLDHDVEIRNKELGRQFPNYKYLSQSMKNAVMDPHFTTNVLGWRLLKGALAALNKKNICNEIHREEAGRPDMISRNQWAAEQCNKGFILK